MRPAGIKGLSHKLKGQSREIWEAYWWFGWIDLIEESDETVQPTEPTSRDKVQVQVQVQATPGLGFLVLLLWTVQLYHKKQLF
jgi:hypothetical protein